MKKTTILSILAGAALSTHSHADVFAFGTFEFELEAAQGTTLTVTSHFVTASAFATFSCLDPNSSCSPALDADACVDPLHCLVTANASSDCQEAGTSTTAESSFGSLGPTQITWNGFFVTDGGATQACRIPLCGGGASVGFEVEFMSDGNFTIQPPTCPDPSTIPARNGRNVIANLICLPGGPVASWLTQHGAINSQNCATATTVGAGTYDLSAFLIEINDIEDDVTGDMRFNQDDVDFLTSIAPTTLATYTDRFDYDDDGDVDTSDIERLQCFVDACLDARRLGDSDCDNDVDCDDLLAVASHPFAGEDFTGTIYQVGFDADLDGDNDAADKTILRDVFLAVEPANLILDATLDFFDLTEFLNLYNASDPLADLDGNGAFDFFDLTLFLNNFNNPNCLP